MYAKTTSAISISSFTSANVAIDTSSSSSFTVTPDPGNLDVTLSSATSTVGATERLRFTLALTNTIGVDGKIHILLPYWNPDAPSPVSIFPTSTATCAAVTNVSSILCTFTSNFGATGTQDKIVVSGSFTSGATSIVFDISNYHNPPSTQPLTTIQVYTSTLTEANKLDQDYSISLTMTTPATLPASNVVITRDNTEINAVTNYVFSITLNNPLPIGARILITFPSEISPESTIENAAGSGKLNLVISADYSSTSKQLTLSELILTSDSYINENEEISFTILGIVNPSTTAASGSFTILTTESIDYQIETVSAGVTVTATAGDITTFSVSPENTKIRERTVYLFTLVTENDVPIGSSIVISFPTEIVIDDGSSVSCILSGTGVSTTTESCSSVSNILTITNVFPTAGVTAGTTFTFRVSSISQNPETTEVTGAFSAKINDASGNVVDMYKSSDVTLTFAMNSIDGLTVTPTSSFTGVETTYTFTIDIGANKFVLKRSYITVVFPDDILIASTTVSAAGCLYVSGFPDTSISCSFIDSSTLKVSNGFVSNEFDDGNLVFSVPGIRNPRSTATTSTFKVYIYDEDGFGQYSIESGEGISVSSISDVTAVSLSRASTVNGIKTTYTFTITLNSIIVSGDYLRIVFPNEIAVQSVTNQCTGITNLTASLTCSLTSNTIYVSIALPTGVSQLPVVAGTTTTSISLSITNVQNPPSLNPTSSIQLYFMTANKINFINQRTTGLTVTNTAAGLLLSASANPDDSGLGAVTNYLISFQPSTSILSGTIVKVQIPSQITVDLTSTITCSRVLVIESTLTCSYDSTTRTVTVSSGFLLSTSYPSSLIQFKISPLTNPSSAKTTDSFVFQTQTSAGVLYDSISSGVTYTKQCNSPCSTCDTDLDKCTS
jgi:hypothetical protein